MTSNNMSSSSSSENDNNNNDLGAPLPNFGSARSIQLQTIAPALGVPQAQLGLPTHSTPDYLDYDPKGRGIVVTMFANAGCAYLLGITSGGIYGFYKGKQATPSTRFRIQLNSILNHCGRYGSRAGNTMGVFAVLYSFYEGMADQYELDDLLGFSRSGWISNSPNTAAAVAPAFGAMATGLTYYAPSGPRVAALGGAIGLGSVFCTYTAYSLLGISPGSFGFLFF